MRIVIYVMTHFLGLAAAAWLLQGIAFDGPVGGGELEVREKFPSVLAVAAILGLVSAVLKPVTKFLSWPFVIITLGAFLVIINATMLVITAWIAGQADLGFHVDDFLSAIFGALIISAVTLAVQTVAGKD
ncbi:phage holin family protein [Nocardioides piscis]|uniref:Phage holin family protein n=1 Tax=Nocardioides piscis TaxID=2714938 RepID=A0A6G7YE26_9ACTN|nr:phage holin family protein [Nocardioides piscis]QIK75055.1 phage holin family protein [Nocardioides piscis]